MFDHSTIQILRRRDHLKHNGTRTRKGKDGHRNPFTDLPADILYEIVDRLQWPHDLHAISLVSRRMNGVATSALYKTVVFPYARPRALLALLTKLETDPELCAHISTLIFDDRAKPLQPLIPSIDADFDSLSSATLENRIREPISRANNLLYQIHHKLYSVLPLLNIQTLVLKRLHPIFLSPPLSHRPPASTATTKMRDVVLNHLPIRQLRAYHQEERIPAAIAMFFTHCHQMRRLVIYDPLSLRSYWTPQLIGNLTVLILALNLDNVVVELDVEDSRAMLLNGILRRAKNLRTLCIVTTWLNFSILLEDCFFPHLEQIEWFHYRAKNPEDPLLFYNFLSAHSETLRHIALAPVAYIVGNWGYIVDRSVRSWLESDLLPHLETLRLHNWEAWAAPQPVYEVTEAQRLETASSIANFVLRRPSIVDVALTNFPSAVSRHLFEGMQSSRVIKRALFGKEERLLRNSVVPRYPPLSALVNSGALFGEYEKLRIQWAFIRKREYLLEAYHSYHVMFEGMELENSGFRPYLLPRKRNAKRDYRR